MLARAVIVFRDRLGTRGIDGARIVVRHRLTISGNRSRGGRDAARIIIVVVRGLPLAHQLLQLLRPQPCRVGIRGAGAAVRIIVRGLSLAHLLLQLLRAQPCRVGLLHLLLLLCLLLRLLLTGIALKLLLPRGRGGCPLLSLDLDLLLLSLLHLLHSRGLGGGALLGLLLLLLRGLLHLPLSLGHLLLLPRQLLLEACLLGCTLLFQQFLLLLDREQGREFVCIAFPDKDGKLGTRIPLVEFLEQLNSSVSNLCR